TELVIRITFRRGIFLFFSGCRQPFLPLLRKKRKACFHEKAGMKIAPHHHVPAPRLFSLLPEPFVYKTQRSCYTEGQAEAQEGRAFPGFSWVVWQKWME